MYRYILATLLLMLSNSAYTEESATQDTKAVIQESLNKERMDSQQVIQQFKDYLLTLSPEAIKEIQEYRKGIAQLNKQKKTLHKELSKQAQLYLAKEQEFKKKLPIKDRKALNQLRKQQMQQTPKTNVVQPDNAQSSAVEQAPLAVEEITSVDNGINSGQ